MKNGEKESYIIVDGKWVKANKWMLFKHHLKNEIKKWKLVNKYSNRIIPLDDMKRYFVLSPIEYEEAKRICKEKGNIEYTFYPCGGVGWGVKVKVIKTGEEFNITDIESW